MRRSLLLLSLSILVIGSSFTKNPNDDGLKISITNLRNNDGIKKAAPLQEPLL